ncbi:hypothetical protein FRAHR75_800021 [Frankia sp. Hr75.2]|nr:hypothetical protein FRAHR75_800021 [Frankia sp. Hr75.2]
MQANAPGKRTDIVIDPPRTALGASGPTPEARDRPPNDTQPSRIRHRHRSR